MRRSSSLPASAGLISVATLLFLPIGWATYMSFISDSSYLRNELSLHSASLANYDELFRNRPFLHWFGVSVTLASVSALGAILLAVPAAHSLSRGTNRKLRHTVISLVLLCYFLPPLFMGLTISGVFKGLLSDSLGRLLIFYPILQLPLIVILLEIAFRSRGRSQEEAFYLESSSQTALIFKVALPMHLPSVGMAWLLGFWAAWCDYVFAFLLLPGGSHSLTTGVAHLQKGDLFQYGAITAAGVACTIGGFLTLSLGAICARKALVPIDD